MPLSLLTDPETVFADVTGRATRLATLSRKLVASDDAYTAVLAIVAADMLRIQAMLWQRLLVNHPEPDGLYAGAVIGVDQALAAGVDDGTLTPDCHSLIEAHRLCLAGAFEQAAWETLRPTLDAVDHLVGVPVPDDNTPAERGANRLAGPLGEAVESRRLRSRDAMVMASALEAEDRAPEAVTIAYRATMAAFEAYLIGLADSWGDSQLGATEVLWALSFSDVERITALPPQVAGAREVLGRTLGGVVGVFEGQRLSEDLASL